MPITGFAAAGMTRVIVVLGYGADAITAALAARDWPVTVETVMSADYRKPNGVSVLAAEAATQGARGAARDVRPSGRSRAVPAAR